MSASLTAAVAFFAIAGVSHATGNRHVFRVIEARTTYGKDHHIRVRLDPGETKVLLHLPKSAAVQRITQERPLLVSELHNANAFHIGNAQTVLPFAMSDRHNAVFANIERSDRAIHVAMEQGQYIVHVKAKPEPTSKTIIQHVDILPHQTQITDVNADRLPYAIANMFKGKGGEKPIVTYDRDRHVLRVVAQKDAHQTIQDAVLRFLGDVKRSGNFPKVYHLDIVSP